MDRNTETETARDIARDNIETLTSTPIDAARVSTFDGNSPQSARSESVQRTPEPDLFDPLKPENLRIDQSELDQPVVKPELTAIPVKRPEKFEFIRVHPDPEYRCGPVSFITIGRSEFYIVPPAFRKSLKPREYWIGQIFLAVNRLEKPFLWMVKLQSPTGRISDWYTSEMECAERAMRDWHPTKMPASTPSFLQKTSSKNRYGQLNRSQNY